jgi:hypothetical protein
MNVYLGILTAVLFILICVLLSVLESAWRAYIYKRRFLEQQKKFRERIGGKNV